MDEDPTVAGGVSDGTTQNEPDQETQTTQINPANQTVQSAQTTQPEQNIQSEQTTPVANPASQPSLSTLTENTVSPTDTTSSTDATNPTISMQGSAPLEFGNSSVEANIVGREPNQIQHINHDVELTPKNKQKSKKTGLVIGIIIGVIVLVFGGLAIWFFAYYQNPEKVAFDAIDKLMRSEQVALNGGVAILSNNSLSNSFESILLNFDSASRTLPNSTNATLIAVPTDPDEATIQISLGTVYLSNGVIYIQINGLMDYIEAEVGDLAMATELEQIFEMVERIDGEWWQISVPDILDELEFSKDETDGLNAMYTCVVDAMNSDNTDEIANLYKQNKFVSIKKVKEISSSEETKLLPPRGHSYYEVSLDNKLLASFINGLPDTSTADTFYECYNSAAKKYNIYEPIKRSNFAEISADDIELSKDMHIYLEVSNFGHVLHSIIIDQKTSDVEFSGNLSFDYEKVPEVVAPNSYRPITELIDEVTELINQISTGYSYDTSVDYDDDWDEAIDWDSEWDYDEEDDEWGY